MRKKIGREREREMSERKGKKREGKKVRERERVGKVYLLLLPK